MSEVRYAFIKDHDRSSYGYDSHEAALAEADKIKEDDDTRVRVRLRNRTDKFDVVVKVRREVK